MGGTLNPKWPLSPPFILQILTWTYPALMLCVNSADLLFPAPETGALLQCQVQADRLIKTQQNFVSSSTLPATQLQWAWQEGFVPPTQHAASTERNLDVNEKCDSRSVWLGERERLEELVGEHLRGENSLPLWGEPDRWRSQAEYFL